MWKKILIVFSVLLVCGSGLIAHHLTKKKVVKMSISAADGPCKGGTFYVSKLSEIDLEPQSTIVYDLDNKGKVEVVSMDAQEPYQMRADCYFYNEKKKKLSEGRVSVNSFYVPGNNSGDLLQGSVTDVTHILGPYLRKVYLENDWRDYRTIRKGCLQKLIREFDFIISGAAGEPIFFNITDGSDPNVQGNDVILAIGLAITNYATQTAILNDEPVTAYIQSVLDNLAKDFEDGELENSGQGTSLVEKIGAALGSLDVAATQAALATYLAQYGGTPPNADLVLDTDGDGTPNAQDNDIDGDGVANADDEAPYDRTVGAGMYVDYENGIAWEISPYFDTFTWSEAFSYCREMVFHSLDNWRMPTYEEVLTLLTDCDDPPCVRNGGPASGCYWPTFFDDEDPCTEGYWSVDAFSEFCGLGLAPQIFYADGESECADKSLRLRVRCVRSLDGSGAGDDKQ